MDLTAHTDYRRSSRHRRHGLNRLSRCRGKISLPGFSSALQVVGSNWTREQRASKSGKDIVDQGTLDHQLVADLKKWLQRSHGEVNFWLTLVISGHGCFRSYQFKFGHDHDLNCPDCGVGQTAACGIGLPTVQSTQAEIPSGNSDEGAPWKEVTMSSFAATTMN